MYQVSNQTQCKHFNDECIKSATKHNDPKYAANTGQITQANHQTSKTIKGRRKWKTYFLIINPQAHICQL